MWSMGDTAWMQCDRRTFDATTAAEVAIDVVNHLLTVYIAVVIRHRYREWMVVQFAWHKRADDKIRSLERLMHRRRLVYAPRDWLEIGNVEDPGILATIPANRIDGMKIIPVARDQVAH